MKTIHKYTISHIEPETTVWLPEGSKLLTIQPQNGKPVLWATTDTESKAAKDVPRVIRSFETGQEIPREFLIYISTVQFQTGYVLHYFEVIPPSNKN